MIVLGLLGKGLLRWLKRLDHTSFPERPVRAMEGMQDGSHSLRSLTREAIFNNIAEFHPQKQLIYKERNCKRV